jgi:AcrR family transcriptional regulator
MLLSFFVSAFEPRYGGQEVRKMAATSAKLRARKQQLVRDAIGDVAIDLFTVKGFDDVTVDEIAQAADVSRRSFFRYFSSKKDVMAQGMLLYGARLRAAIEACPRSCSLREILEQATLEVAKHTAAQARTRQVFRIAECSTAAREALLSSLPVVEDQVTKAFETHLRKGSKDLLKPRLLAALTLTILNVSIGVWCRSEREDISIIVRRAFSTLSQLV